MKGMNVGVRVTSSRTEARTNFEESWRNDVLVGDQLQGDWFDVVWLMSKLPCGYRNRT